jgi:hypothetical protein
MGNDSPTSDPATAVDRLTAVDRTGRWLGPIVLLALFLRLPLLDRPVWFDEACMSSQRIGTTAQWLATLYVDIHPPGFVTFMHFLGRWFGDGEVVLRLPALLAGLLAIPALHWAGKRWIGGRAATWAALWLALSPAHLWYSVEARLYTPMLLLAVVSLGTTDRLMAPYDGQRRRTLWTCHCLVVAAMLLLHYYLAVWVGMLALVGPWLAKSLRGAARRLLILHVVALLLLAAFLFGKRLLGTFETSQDYLRALDARELGLFVFDWCWTGHVLFFDGQPWRAIGWLAVGLGVLLTSVGAVALLRSWRQRRPLLVLVGLLTVPAFLMACALLGLDRTYMERSTIASLPFVLLLAATGLEALPHGVRRVVAAIVLATQLAAVLCLFLFHKTHWTVYKPNADWRGAAAWLGQQIDREGAARPLFTSTPNPRSLSYYDVRIQSDKNLRLPIEPEALGRKVTARLGGWCGELAAATMADFAAHNQALRANAKIVCYRSQSDPTALLAIARASDDVCYLLLDEWHPPRSEDNSIGELLDNPKVKVLDSFRSFGIQVHKVRMTP